MQITTLPKDDVKRGEIYYISRGGYNTGSEKQADRPGVKRIGKYIGVCTAQEMQNIDIGLMISIGLGDAGGGDEGQNSCH